MTRVGYEGVGMIDGQVGTMVGQATFWKKVWTFYPDDFDILKPTWIGFCQCSVQEKHISCNNINSHCTDTFFLLLDWFSPFPSRWTDHSLHALENTWCNTISDLAKINFEILLQDRFKLLQKDGWHFHDLAKPSVDDAVFKSLLKSEEVQSFTDWLKEPNLLLTTHLQEVKSGSKVIVGATHLKWEGFQLPALKMLQVNIMSITDQLSVMQIKV